MSVEGQAPHPLGSEVTYHCDDGLFPTSVMTSTCTDVGGRGEWVPDPAQLMCRVPGRPDPVLYCCNFVLSVYTMNYICILLSVTCRLPEEPLHGLIMDYCSLATTEGSVITFQCDPGFSPAAEMTATCSSSGQWSTDPSQLVCTSNGERWKMSFIL